ncbi:hypothetical protein N018_12705 [Pseudomonas syringae CC1557]|uniref:DUF1444 family protein n=1 Tax=Pseudomonas syringae CC1557 TaxID=1357279 RepID=W0MR63_PSESX|nr:hypothetical protein [Pseudomonas syringae]AHG41034.1 hypothetical protein N018_12705 [Pseudomonas syringae CC1557]
MLKKLLNRLLNRPLTKQQFAEYLIAATREKGFTGPLDYRPEEFRIQHGDNSYLNLHNAFEEYQNADKSEKTQIVVKYVSAFIHANSAPSASRRTFEDARSLLRPVIRNLTTYEEIRLNQVRTKGWDAPFEIAQRAFGKDCAVLLAVDYPDSRSILFNGIPDDWDITLDEGLSIAIQNLREDTEYRFEEISPGLHAGRWSDGYDISRVLLPDVLQRIPLQGQPVFMIPTRDVLMVAGDEDEQAIRHMIQVCFQVTESECVVSSQLYTYQDEKVVTFLPQDKDNRVLLATLERVLLQDEYASQKTLLDAIHDEHQEDVFVASYSLYKSDESSESTFSICSWTENVITLLPKTDWVSLVQPLQDGSTHPRIVEWEELERRFGELMKPATLYPIRFRVDGFPTAEQLSQLP